MTDLNVANSHMSETDMKAHCLPYTTKESKIEEWCKYAILKCYAKSRSASTMFGWSREEIDSQKANHYLAFIEEMISLYEGTWNGKGLDFLTKEGGDQQILPARLQNYPLLKNNFDIIVGQFLQTGIDMSVAHVSPDAITKKMKKRAELMFNKLLGSDMKAIEETTGVQIQESMPIVDDEDKYITLTWKEVEEINMSKLLKKCYIDHEWPEAIRKNMLGQLLFGFLFYKIEEVNRDEVRLRVPRWQNILADWNCEDDFGEDMMFIGEERFMMPASIEQSIQPSPEKMELIKKHYEQVIENGGTDSAAYGQIANRNGIRVIDMTWYVDIETKAKIVNNPYNPNKKIVKFLKNGEEGHLTKKEIEKLSGEIKTVKRGGWYRAYLIGADIVVGNELCQDMPIEDNNMAYPKNDWVIGLYNRMNKKPNGMMASIKGIQEVWNELMWKLELEIATSPGNIVEYAADGKPANLSYSQVFYYMKAKKLLITKKPGAARTIQMGLESTQHIMNLLMYFENLIDVMTGVSKFKKGDVAGDTYVGTMQAAIAQSDLLLVPYYNFHKAVLRKVFKRSAAKLTLLNQHDGEKVKYLLGETGFEYFRVERTLPTMMWDIYFVDGNYQRQKKEMLMSLFDKAFSTGQATLEHAIAIIKHDNINEIYAALGNLTKEAKLVAAKQSEIANQIESAKLQQPFELEQLKGNINQQIEQMKKQFETAIAQIYADAGIKKEVVLEDIKKKQSNLNNNNPN